MGIFILIIAFAIAAIAYGYHAGKKRREELLAFATELGLSFETAAGDVHYHFDEFTPFGQGSSQRSENLIHGEFEGLVWDIFDYQYTTGSGKNRQTHTYGIIATSLPVTLPGLEIRPEGWLDKVAGLVGFEDINFESEAFSRRFHVKCDSRKVAFDIIHPRMIEFLMSIEPIHWQIRGTRLILIRKGRYSAAQIRQSMGQIQGFIEQIPGYVRQDRGMHF